MNARIHLGDGPVRSPPVAVAMGNRLPDQAVVTRYRKGKPCPGGCGGWCSWDAKLCRDCHKRATVANRIPSARQMQVMKVWTQQGSIKDAADKLGISDKTVEYHLQTIRAKLKLESLYDLMKWACRSGFVR